MKKFLLDFFKNCGSEKTTKKRKEFDEFLNNARIFSEKGEISKAIQNIESALVLYPDDKIAIKLHKKYVKMKLENSNKPVKMQKSKIIIENRKKAKLESFSNQVENSKDQQSKKSTLNQSKSQNNAPSKENETNMRTSSAYNEVWSGKTEFERYQIASKITNDWINIAEDLKVQEEYREAFPYYEDAIWLGNKFFYPFTSTSYIWSRLFLFCLDIGVDERLANEAWKKESFTMVKELVRSKLN